MKTPTQLGFELDYQETQSMEYARHPFDTLLTYETWLENKALISKSFIKKKKKKAEIILTRQPNDLFY